MPIMVELHRIDEEGTESTESYHGDNVSVRENILYIWTEPHEIKPGGIIDLFIGKIIVLEEGDMVEVKRA